MVDQRQGAESADELAVAGLDDGDAVGDAVAAVVEGLGGKIVLASSVDQFGEADEHAPAVEEAVDLDELLVGGHLGDF